MAKKTATKTEAIESTATETGTGTGAATAPAPAQAPPAQAQAQAQAQVIHQLFKTIGSGQIDPRELVIDEEANGRRYPTDVQGMAKSLQFNGQEQPIVVRVQDGRYHVVFGYRRARGGVYLLEHGLVNEFQLRYEVVDMTADEAYLHNLIENKDRQGTSVIDDAHNYLRLMAAPFNWSQTQIAQRLDVSDALVSRGLTLVRGTKDGKFPPLDAKTQKLIHLGKIARESAYNLVNMTVEQREEWVHKLLHGEANSSDTKQASATRKKAAKGKDGKGDEQAGKALTAKAIRLPFEEVVTKHDPEEEMTVYVQVCDVLVRMMSGKLQAKTGLRKIKDLVGG